MRILCREQYSQEGSRPEDTKHKKVSISHVSDTILKKKTPNIVLGLVPLTAFMDA